MGTASAVAGQTGVHDCRVAGTIFLALAEGIDSMRVDSLPDHRTATILRRCLLVSVVASGLCLPSAVGAQSDQRATTQPDEGRAPTSEIQRSSRTRRARAARPDAHRGRRRARVDGMPRVMPVSVATTIVDGNPVVPSGWIEEQIRWANEIFAPSGVSFEITARRPLGAEHAHVETRRDRHVLARELHDEVINVFVVESLADVDIDGRYIRGVHWRGRWRPGSHYVIISAIAPTAVLAHELGHFFGNPHSTTVGNVMCYERGDVEVPFFDPRQLERIREHATEFLATGELVGGSSGHARPAVQRSRQSSGAQDDRSGRREPATRPARRGAIRNSGSERTTRRSRVTHPGEPRRAPSAPSGRAFRRSA